MSRFSIKKITDEKGDGYFLIRITNKMLNKDEMIHLANLLLDMVDNGRGN